MASRSGFGVPPSMCSARTPDLMNSSRRWTLVRDVDREADGLPALTVFVPVRDDVADQLGRSMRSASWLHIVAAFGAHAGQVGLDRRVDADRDQIPLRDQLGDLRALDHGVEDSPSPRSVASAGRGGQAEARRSG